MAKKSNEDINECIEFIESMAIQVNYRDAKILKEAGLPKIKVENYNRCGKKKISYTFEEIKLEFIKNGKDIAKLEQDYRVRKERYARIGDADLLSVNPNAKIDIADKFIDFIDEVQKTLELLLDEKNKLVVLGGKNYNEAGVLEKSSSKTGNRRGLNIVYNDINVADVVNVVEYRDDGTDKIRELYDEEQVPDNNTYQFISLPILLDTIARITVDYCKDMDNIKSNKKKEQVTPLFIRKTCAWICYTLLYFGDILSKYYLSKPLSSRSGVCSQIMHDLHLRTKHDYKYEYFAKEKKLLEYNKWSILPDLILREGNFVAPLSPVNYAGHKSGYLGYMLQSLVEQRVFDTYLEPFGGSGIGITQFNKEKNKNYYICDGNYANMCYYRVYKLSDDDFEKFINRLESEQKKVDAFYSRIDDLYIKQENYKYFFQNMSDKGFDKYYTKGKGFDSSRLTDADVVSFFENKVKTSESRFERMKNEAIVSLEVHYALKDYYRPFKDLYDYCGNNFLDNKALSKIKATGEDLAIAFIILHSSLVSGNVSIDQSILSPPTFRNLNIRRRLRFMREAYRLVNTVPKAKYGADAIKLLRNKDYNKENIFTYLDSPYINSMGYSIGFDIKDMLALQKSCKNFKGDLVFSCRANLPIKSLSDEYSKSIFVLYFNKWLELKKRYEEQGKSCKVLFLKYPLVLQDNVIKRTRKDNSNDFVWSVSKETYKYMLKNNIISEEYQFLASCIESGKDLELMITNFDFDIPDYNDYIESIPLSKAQKQAKQKANLSNPYEKIEFIKVDIEDVVNLVKFIYR